MKKEHKDFGMPLSNNEMKHLVGGTETCGIIYCTTSSYFTQTIYGASTAEMNNALITCLNCFPDTTSAVVGGVANCGGGCP